MSNYRLTQDAKEDLREIYFYSLRTFGAGQADKYIDNMLNCLSLIREHQELGRSYEHIRAKLRRHEHESHAIYYQIEDVDVLIMRILGAEQDPARHL